MIFFLTVEILSRLLKQYLKAFVTVVDAIVVVTEECKRKLLRPIDGGKF